MAPPAASTSSENTLAIASGLTSGAENTEHDVAAGESPENLTENDAAAIVRTFSSFFCVGLTLNRKPDARMKRTKENGKKRLKKPNGSPGHP